MSTVLPVDDVIPEIKEALRDGHNAVLQAPPGAGKTTRLPLALLDEAWLNGNRILMLEPRRLAARSAAHYMARQLGEGVGGTVGYRVRMDSRVSKRTRIEVLTEGVLTRLLQDDPSLSGVGLVIFDEFHERSLQADVGLALCVEIRAALRGDLRLLVMSATLAGEPVAALLGNTPVITSVGRSFPVVTSYLPPDPRRAGGYPFLDHVASAVKRAIAEESGSILVFLPGVTEIKRVERLIRDMPLVPQALILPLYGELSQEKQEQAILPAVAGQRKIVLATSIAETSLTIEGIRVVIDSGLARVPRFDPVSGLTRLTTVPASQASAEQRRGRAGRLEPGVCYRLWSEGAHHKLPAYNRPEILEADLATLALDIAQWGINDPGKLAWLDPPPPAHYAQARELLQELGALDHNGAITAHGRRMSQLAMHPRLAHMVLMGMELGHGALACDLAALLSERDIITTRVLDGSIKGARDADLHLRVQALHTDWPSPLTLSQRERVSKQMDMKIDRGACARARKQAEQWRRQLRISDHDTAHSDHTGLLLAYAYPDRIAQRRPGGEPRYLLANGRGAFFAHHEPLSTAEYIVAAHLDGAQNTQSAAAGIKEARIFLAAAITRVEVEGHFAGLIASKDSIAWNGRDEYVQAHRQRRLGALILDDAPLSNADPAAVTDAMLQGIREMGIACLPWSNDQSAAGVVNGLRSWQQRVRFLHRLQPQQWPDVSDEYLLATLDDWLAPYLIGITRRPHLAKIDLHAALIGRLSWEQQRSLEELAPTHFTVPSGSRIPIDYTNDPPVLAVRLQEMFGLKETPCIAGGRAALLIRLLSPAYRPVQVTQDLAGFWAHGYHDVKKDLKGRYPKHYWPDDPLQAQATARAKPR